MERYSRVITSCSTFFDIAVLFLKRRSAVNYVLVSKVRRLFLVLCAVLQACRDNRFCSLDFTIGASDLQR